jgi:hypothetical protein
VQVTEWDEPQAVIGSYLQRYAYPDWYRQHREATAACCRRRIRPRTERRGQCLQLRGEYLYVAEGARGHAGLRRGQSIANKGVSQRIITAPFSPLGQDTHIASSNATCVALPTNQPMRPSRNRAT